ncbi:lysozyme inhibitor LprI family protein [Pleomorphomonas sp. NRK KF1]|uniref:lysozyme inhibitor LprI family protein n=1 Tax=Pleomorphomonas sp. NRK KF1 TaxID=2943000 RepID=UPI00204352AF|nr:hypothetical protein [Pleomorphomonas sp. NRK KF1]MCM5553361.1 hypothetical protein [Pleomorphomonas sp. NRK KF1]
MTGNPGVRTTLCIAIMTTPANSTTPSFDCDRTLSSVESLICGDDLLASLDMRLASTFAQLLAQANASEVVDLLAEHRAWRVRLNQCGKENNLRACTMNIYEDRLHTLETRPRARLP